MKRDNRGLSLIEVVIVITILAVLGSLMTLGVGAAVSKPADECANKIVSSLNNGRITTMGKQSITLEYYVDNERVYLKKSIVAKAGQTPYVEVTQIGGRGVVVEYKLVGEATYTNLDGNDMILTFKRSSGGFNQEHNSGEYVEEIKVSKGNKVRIIKLQYLTGKVTLE